MKKYLIIAFILIFAAAANLCPAKAFYIDAVGFMPNICILSSYGIADAIKTHSTKEACCFC